MTVSIKSLRATADVDSSQYERGVGTRPTRASAAKAIPDLGRVTRAYISGYADAARFEAAARRVGDAVDRRKTKKT